MPGLNVEGGSRRTNYYFCREVVDQFGDAQTPADPDWTLYGKVENSFEPETEATHSERTGIGNVDPVDKRRNQESHEVTLSYDLERFPVDGTGDPLDPIADGMLRDIDNRLLNTHSLLAVEQLSGIIATNTVHAKYFADARGRTHPSGDAPTATALSTRKYDYAYGGRPTEPSISVDPGEDAVATAELQYTFDKRRKYQIDQPDATTYLAIRSTDASDTGVTVTVEAIDGQTVEDITLDGTDATTSVVTTSQYDSLAVVAPASELEGTLEVYADESVDQTGEPGQLLTVVPGKSDYDGIEGDEGVPPLGAGSFDDGSSLGQPQLVLGSKLQWFGDPAAERVQSTTLTVSNEVEEENTTDGLAMSHHEDGRNVQAESTVFGETQTNDKLSDHLQGAEGELVIPLTGGDIALPRAYISSGGNATKEENQAYMTTDLTFTGLQQSDGSAALEFRPN
ncbi:hypothetical protein [Halomarina oriensis]|uniref:Uncharacterized protein n=1 Tax=Halomarina oriensis TaxID=671145 RepID=A0A6B0GJP2_9EURY|nr:hypothetical protein [Halomarina oriensis]MWG34820.1 hypothetical protein [Halomarina oriensis]